MGKGKVTGILVMFLVLMTGCKSFSNYGIDTKTLIKTDTNLFGIWKAVEDKNKESFILIEGYAEMSKGEKEIVEGEPYILRNNTYYYLTRWEDSRRRHRLNHFPAFESIVSGVSFLNVFYFREFMPGGTDKEGKPLVYPERKYEQGYFFVRLTRRSPDTIITSTVADTTLKYLASSQQVRSRIMKNINNPHFYRDTLHFYKVSGRTTLEEVDKQY